MPNDPTYREQLVAALAAEFGIADPASLGEPELIAAQQIVNCRAYERWRAEALGRARGDRPVFTGDLHEVLEIVCRPEWTHLVKREEL
jgi:hypothetical protein